MRPTRILPTALALLTLAAPAAAHARAGDLDRTFGTAGRATIGGGYPSPWRSPADGGAWRGGHGRTLVGLNGGGLARLTARGAVDRTWGGGEGLNADVEPGVQEVVPLFGGGVLAYTPARFDGARHVLLGADGLAASSSARLSAALNADVGASAGFEVVRLDDGTLLELNAARDGRTLLRRLTVAGKVLSHTWVSQPAEVRYRGVVGRRAIVAVARDAVVVPAGADERFATLVRLRRDGMLDRRWGQGGRAVMPMRTVSSLARWSRGVVAGDGRSLTWVDARGRVIAHRPVKVEAMAVDGHGRVVVVRTIGLPPEGEEGEEPGDPQVSVLRFLRNGRLDRAFGRGGRLHLAARRPTRARAVVIQPDGRIVVVAAGLRYELIHDRGDYLDFADHGTVVWRLRGR